MSNSPLAEFHLDSPNRYTRTGPIYNIIPHHAGTVNCPEIEHFKGTFMTPGTGKSSHYVIGVDGRIGQYLDEKYGATTSSNMAIDKRSVTIEVCNDGGYPDWHVSDASLESLVNLCVDICRRNPTIGKLNYTGDTDGNLLMHKMLANTGCPGPYLSSKFPYIAEEVNRRLNMNAPDIPADDPAPEEKPNPSGELAIGDEVRLAPNAVYTTGKPVPEWVIKSLLYVRAIQGDVITVSIYKEGAVTGPVSRQYVIKEGVEEAPVKPEVPAEPPAEPSEQPAAPVVPYEVTTAEYTPVYCAPGIHTIVEEKDGYGRLADGGWIKL